MIKFKLGQLIKKFEIENCRSLSLEEITKKTGIHRSTLSKIINNRECNITLYNIDCLCEFFDCAIEELIEREPGLSEMMKEKLKKRLE
ncbi:putative transcriptional regulator [Geoalkalibacter ferrihydriticus]|uniref:Putative transcriptional regulator n=1 Tax=Geoalkalibacter ferrihydriticus TaxID=392333 RepID=A0A1G9QQ70_9BACT|nr:helix-turn-helix transcriptional regulator [Geoalkalibacter ferrihydriticus]SDM12435.1 putative transcriptional regulator [Geoalkalibacter ferrihydriticus]